MRFKSQPSRTEACSPYLFTKLSHSDEEFVSKQRGVRCQREFRGPLPEAILLPLPVTPPSSVVSEAMAIIPTGRNPTRGAISTETVLPTAIQIPIPLTMRSGVSASGVALHMGRYISKGLVIDRPEVRWVTLSRTNEVSAKRESVLNSTGDLNTSRGDPLRLTQCFVVEQRALTTTRRRVRIHTATLVMGEVQGDMLQSFELGTPHVSNQFDGFTSTVDTSGPAVMVSAGVSQSYPCTPLLLMGRPKRPRVHYGACEVGPLETPRAYGRGSLLLTYPHHGARRVHANHRCRGKTTVRHLVHLAQAILDLPLKSFGCQGLSRQGSMLPLAECASAGGHGCRVILETPQHSACYTVPSEGLQRLHEGRRPTAVDINLGYNTEKGLEWYREGVRRALDCRDSSAVLMGLGRVRAFQRNEEGGSPAGSHLVDFLAGAISGTCESDTSTSYVHFSTIRDLCDAVNGIQAILPSSLCKVWCGLGTSTLASGAITGITASNEGDTCGVGHAVNIVIGREIPRKSGDANGIWIVVGDPIFSPTERGAGMACSARPRAGVDLLALIGGSVVPAEATAGDRLVDTAARELAHAADAMWARILKGVGKDHPLRTAPWGVSHTLVTTPRGRLLDAIGARLLVLQQIKGLPEPSGLSVSLDDIETCIVQLYSLRTLGVLGVSGCAGGGGVAFDGWRVLRHARQGMIDQIGCGPSLREYSHATTKVSLGIRTWQYLGYRLVKCTDKGARESALENHIARERPSSVLLLINAARHPLSAFHHMLHELVRGAPTSTAGVVNSVGGAAVDYLVSDGIRVAVADIRVFVSNDEELVGELIRTFGGLVVFWEVRCGLESTHDFGMLTTIESRINAHNLGSRVVVLPQPLLPVEVCV